MRAGKGKLDCGHRIERVGVILLQDDVFGQFRTGYCRACSPAPSHCHGHPLGRCIPPLTVGVAFCGPLNLRVAIGSIPVVKRDVERHVANVCIRGRIQDRILHIRILNCIERKQRQHLPADGRASSVGQHVIGGAATLRRRIYAEAYKGVGGGASLRAISVSGNPELVVGKSTSHQILMRAAAQ